MLSLQPSLYLGCWFDRLALDTTPWQAESQREKSSLGYLWSQVYPNWTEPMRAFFQEGLCGLSDTAGLGQGWHQELEVVHD